MSKINARELRKYYSEISKSVICPGKQKKAFMRQLQSDVDSYLNENPEATFDEIKNCFGTAQTIAQSFIVNSDSRELRSKLDLKKLIVIAVVAVLLIYLAFIVISLIDVHTEAHGYFKEGILVISGILKDGVSL